MTKYGSFTTKMTQTNHIKVRFEKDEKGIWWHKDNGAALGWGQGIMVIWISDTDVGLGTLREPIGSQPRDKFIDEWLDENVDFA